MIVEAIDMERHTQGIDPFTGKYSYNIPKEHQVDPKTEEVIWHRYVAGTRQPIEWPWEESRQKKADDARRPGAEKPENKDTDLMQNLEEEKTGGVTDILKKANPLNWLRGDKAEKKTEVVSKAADEDNLTETYNPETEIRTRPRESEPVEHADDTPRNIVESVNFIPYLIYRPLPETIGEELAGLAKEQKEIDAEKEVELRVQRKAAVAEKKLEKERILAARISSMKTPMQLRWELEQVKKVKYDPKAPQPASEDLLLALGKHMAAKGVTPKGLKKEVNELTA